MDTMGQAQAMTGGYGNSYAQTVGQQTYQGYLQGLNDQVPALYQLALDKYNSEGNQLKDNMGIRQFRAVKRVSTQCIIYTPPQSLIRNQLNCIIKRAIKYKTVLIMVFRHLFLHFVR